MTYPSDSAMAGAGPAARRAWTGRSDEAVLADSLRCPEAFGELYSRYFPQVWRYVAGRLGPDAADDLAAETFLDAFRQRGRFDPAIGTVRPWLYGIATNFVARHHRDEARWYRALARAGADPVAANGIALSEEDQIADRIAARQARPALASALARLPDRDRDVLLLTALGGLSYAEVAFALAVPEGTVGSRLNRARRKVIADLDRTRPAAATAHYDLRGN